MADPLENLVANMTIAQLAKLSGKTVADIAAIALAGSAPKSNGAAKAERPARAGKRSRVGTRAVGGDFDARVLKAIEVAGGPVRSVDIEDQVGGTPVQRRAALHRLVAAKKVKRAGVSRATTYTAK